MSGLEAEPGPGRAEAQPSRPAGLAGRAQPARSPSKCRVQLVSAGSAAARWIDM